jgi:hypothetical protein
MERRRFIVRAGGALAAAGAPAVVHAHQQLVRA